MSMAAERVAFQGLPARICWLGYGERAKAGLRFNELVATGKVKAPIVIGRDHLDCRIGGVAQPRDRGDARRLGRNRRLADPQCAVEHRSGATWVSVHHGGGVGIGYSTPRGDGDRRGRHRRCRAGGWSVC